MKSQILASLIALTSFVLPASSLNPNCKDVRLTVTGSALNYNLTDSSIFQNSTTLLDWVKANPPNIPVSGKQTIAGTYCEANVRNSNNKKLQILFSSATGNRDDWSALGGTGLGYEPYKPGTYSWVDYMNKQGYPTLALDRLGSGQSSHPDPLLVVQAAYESELYHNLALQARAGSTGCLPRRFSDLTWVGCSYGSELGTLSASKYPKDFDAYILTGFSKRILPAFAGISLQTPGPAAIVDPARFGNLHPGYVTSSSEQPRTNTFFGSHEDVDFEDQVANLVWTRKDVVSLGQFLGIFTLPTEAPQYRGRVLVLTGEQDQSFCGLGSSALGSASCGNLLAETKTLFPRADYNWKSVNRTGHGIQFHLSAQRTYGIASAFLGGKAFSGGKPA